MEFSEAEKLSRYVVGANALLHQALTQLEGILPPEEYRKLAKEIGGISGEAYAAILRPLWKEHRDLNSEATGGKTKYDQETLIKLGQLVEKMPIEYSEPN